MSLTAAELVGYLTLDDSDYDQKLSRAEGKAQSASSKIGGALGTAGKALATAATVTGGAVTGLVVTAVKAGAAYNGMQQASRAALTTILGGAQAANAQMDKLDEFARNSPFAKQVFIKAQQQLLGFGVAAEDVVPTLDAIQNAVAAVGGSNDDITRITDSLAKMMGSGKLTGETLNELGQYGINAADLIGDQMGKTGAEIRDMASKPGGIPADQVFGVLTTAMTEKFGGAADNVKKTWVGATDRIKGAWRDIGSNLAEPFVSHTGGGAAIDWVNSVADAMRALQSKITPTVEVLEDRFGPALDQVDPTIDKITDAINDFDPSKLNDFFDKAAGFGPILAGVSTAITTLGTNNIPILSRLGFAINPVAAGILAVVAASPELRAEAGELLQALSPLLPVVTDMGGVLASSLAPAIDGVVTVAKPAVQVVGFLADGFASLPTPIQNAVIAFAALKVVKGYIGGVVDQVRGPLAGAVRTGSGLLDTIRLHFMYAGDAAANAGGGVKGLASGIRVGLSGALKSVSGMLVRGGLWGLAIAGATVLIDHFAKKHEEAQRAAEESKNNISALTDTFDKNTGSISKNTDEWLKNKLITEDMVGKARRLGIPYELLFKAVRDGGPALDQFNDMLEKNGTHFLEVNDAGGETSRTIKVFDKDAKVLRDTVGGLNGNLSEAQKNARYMAESGGKAATATDSWSRANQDAAEQIGGAAGAASRAGDKIAQLTGQTDKNRKSADQAREAIDKYAAAVKGLGSKAVDAREANRDFQQAIDDVREQVTKARKGVDGYSRGLSDNTDAGRDNNDMLYRLREMTLQKVGTDIEQHKSQKQVNDTVKEGRDEFVKAAIALDNSNRSDKAKRESAEKLADRLGLTTDKVKALREEFIKTDKTTAKPKVEPQGIRAARRQIADVIADLIKLNNSDAKPTVKVVGTALAAAQIGGIIAGLDNLDGKTATSTVTTKKVTITSKQKASPFGFNFFDDDPKHATGTIAARAGYAWVGERGPELVRFRGGEQVTPAAQSQGLAGSLSNDNRTTINHYGDIRANDPGQYQAEIERKQRLQALGAQ